MSDPLAAEARVLYELALESAPQIGIHHRIPGSLRHFEGSDVVFTLVQRAVGVDPSFGRAHAALGNLWSRYGRVEEALAAYRAAVAADPDFAAAHLGLAELLHNTSDEEGAERHLQIALSRRVLYSERPANPQRSILVLCAPRPWSMNAPLDFVLNAERSEIHRLYVAPEHPPQTQELPAYDLVFSALGELERSQATIELARQFVDAQSKPVINHPHFLERIARAALPATLDGVGSCIVPRTMRLSRDEAAAFAEFGFPFLIRPVDSHGGRGLELVGTASQLQAYLARFDAAAFIVAEYVDYRDSDGFYRKYRVVLVDGEPFAYHLAISPEWMVHYYKTPMREHAWMRAEEERFMEDPGSVFPAWETSFRAIARAIGLDYFAIDCARAPDGAVVVFEADAAMLVHCLDPLEIFPYKHRLVPRIFAALEDLLERRGGNSHSP